MLFEAVFRTKALCPKAVLLLPDILYRRESFPSAALLAPTVLQSKA